MSLTQSQTKTLISQFMDDASNKRWSDTGAPSPLEIAAGLVYDQAWSEIIDEAPWIVSKREVVAAAALTSPGYIDTVSGGDLTNRFHRVQKIFRDGVEYSPAMLDEVVIDETNSKLLSAPNRTYWVIGKHIWLSPLSTSQTVDIRYSYMPTAFNGLGDSVSIAWPDGHELAFVYRAAYELLGKGNVEETTELRNNADKSWKTLLRYVRRRYPGPRTMRVAGDPLEWGS